MYTLYCELYLADIFSFLCRELNIGLHISFDELHLSLQGLIQRLNLNQKWNNSVILFMNDSCENLVFDTQGEYIIMCLQ